MSSVILKLLFFCLFVVYTFCLNKNNLTKSQTVNLNLNKISPIILIPGLEGSQLLAKLNKNSSSHYYCRKKFENYYSIWVSLEELFIPIVNCFIENLSLNYDNITHRTSNNLGVTIKVPGFGKTETIENLVGDSSYFRFNYFYEIVEKLVSIGYVRGKTLKGAPYDFRKAPNEHDDYFNSLIQLIENTYSDCNNEKVIIICHSMGCLYLLNLLNVRVNNEWSNKYISTIFTFSAPWSGSTRALKTMITGDNMGIFVFNDQIFQKMEQTFPSITFLLPKSNTFDSTFTIVSTPSKNYTIQDYKQLFKKINSSNVYDMYLDTKDLVGNLKFPNINLHCIYSTGLLTDKQIIYEKEKDFPLYPKLIKDLNGDSTVNLHSLEYCLNWKKKFKNKVNILKLDNVDHIHILKDSRSLDYLVKNLKLLSKK